MNVYYKFLCLTHFLLIFWSNWEITLIIQIFSNYSLIQLLLFYNFINNFRNLFYNNFGNYCDMSEMFRDFSDIISREIAWLFLILFRERLRDLFPNIYIINNMICRLFPQFTSLPICQQFQHLIYSRGIK